jgi:hypothetical protein
MTQPVQPPDGADPPDGTGDPDEFPAEMNYPRLAPTLVAVTLVLFLSMVALLCYRWLSMAEPNGFIEVQGDPAFVGVRVEVTGETLAAPSSTRLTSANHYVAHFPLPAGTYHLSILQDDRRLDARDVTLREGSGFVYPLPPSMLPSTRPTTSPTLSDPLPAAPSF